MFYKKNDTLRSIATPISIAIVLVGSAIFFQFLETRPSATQWNNVSVMQADKTGDGFSFPACASASNSASTCVSDTSAQMTITPRWLDYTMSVFDGRFFCSSVPYDVTVTIPGVGSQTVTSLFDVIANDCPKNGVTFSSLTPGTTYTYTAEGIVMHSEGGTLTSETYSGSFTTPMCGTLLPDLISQNFVISIGPYTLGIPITLNAEVRNIGIFDTPSGFYDNFSYQWNGTSSAWTVFTTLTKAVLGANDTSPDGTTFIPDSAGTLYLQHCVDSANDIKEGVGNERNCKVSAPRTVTSTGSQCSNGIDDADPEDTLIDMADPGCSSPSDTDETNGAIPVNITTFTATPRVVERGSLGTLKWTLTGINEAGCSLTGGLLGSSQTPVRGNDILGNPSTGSLSVIVEGKTTYTLTCGGVSKTATFEVVPIGFET